MMMNSLYRQLNPLPQNNLLSQFLQFKKTFTGNPQEMVQSLLNSGRVTQEQINRYAQQANEIMRQLNGK
jgi:hypothetical protein